jgi:hypothetical protein
MIELKNVPASMIALNRINICQQDKREDAFFECSG